MIRSSKHTLRFSNSQKLEKYAIFIKEYRRVAKIILDFLWEDGWLYESKNIFRIFDIESDNLNCPSMLEKEINEVVGETILSARALKCCSTQVCGMIKAVVEKRRRTLWLINKLKFENKPFYKVERKLQSLVKPNICHINPEINSLCCDFQMGTSFDGFLQLHSLGKDFGKIRIPIKFHKSSNKWKLKGNMMTSFLLANQYVAIRWEIEIPAEREIGVSVGMDQGKKKVAILGEAKAETIDFYGKETVTKKTDIHGYSLDSIIKKLSRKRKGSKAFHKTQKHRKNFINWSINNLNLDGIKEIRLEKIVNINYRKRTSRLMSHWVNTLIRDKVLLICEELGVQVTQQDSTYRSQRCSRCGQVRKANRSGEFYKCANCGLEIDADLNAARNHAQDLPTIPVTLRKLRKNLGRGFLWKPEGFFEMTGEEFTVPLSNNER